MDPDKFTTILKAGVLEYDAENYCPAVLPMRSFFEMEITPKVAAGFLTAMIEAMVDRFPESEQIEFEKNTLSFFKKMIKIREEHTEKIKLSIEDE